VGRNQEEAEGFQMVRALLIRPEAESDIEGAYRWYEKQSAGLGAEFLFCLEEGFGRVQRSPERYPVVYRHLRRHLIRRFPYGIFYMQQEDVIVVVAVLHGRRNPDEWKSRN